MKRQSVIITGAIALIIVVLFSLGIRIEHPQSGLSNSLGSAKSGLVIIKPANQITLGDKLLVTSNTEESPVLGMVSGISGNSIDIHLQSGFIRVVQKEVVGKMVLVVPYFGIPLGLFGF